MKIALIGASGYLGRALTEEAVGRGHDVTAIVRTPEKVPASPRVTAIRGDVFDMDGLTALLVGHDVAVAAFSANGSANVEEDFVRAADAILAAVEASGVPRLAVVGGAASLEIAPGKLLFDTPDFNPAWKEGARGTLRFLEK